MYEVSGELIVTLIAKLRERLAIRKQEAQKFDGKRFNLRKLNDLEVRKQYQIGITNSFAALENLSKDKDISMTCDSIKGISKPQLKRV
jgi:hypothetical protein